MKVTVGRVRDRADRRRGPDRRSATTDIESLGYFFYYPGTSSGSPVTRSGQSYWALLEGAVGSGRAISQTLERATPLIFAGLGVTLAFRAGLFNIGAPGSADRRRDRRRLRRLHVEPAPGPPPAGGPRGGRRRRCALGRASPACSRPAPAPTRSSPRSCSTTWPTSLLLFLLTKDAFQRPGATTALAARRRFALVPVGPRHAHRRGPRNPRRRRRLVAARAQHARLRDAGRRANADAAAHRRHERGKVYTLAMLVAGALAGLAATMQVLGKTTRSPRTWPARWASTRSRWRCWAGPLRSAPCWPACSSAPWPRRRADAGQRAATPVSLTVGPAGADRTVRGRACPGARGRSG